MADQDTSWTWNFSGPSTESKALSRPSVPKEIAWELIGVDGNSVGSLRTHPGFKSVASFTVPTGGLLQDVFPITVLINGTSFVYGSIYFCTHSSTTETKAYLHITADGTTYYTSIVHADLTWAGITNEVSVEVMGKFLFVFVIFFKLVHPSQQKCR